MHPFLSHRAVSRAALLALLVGSGACRRDPAEAPPTTADAAMASPAATRAHATGAPVPAEAAAPVDGRIVPVADVLALAADPFAPAADPRAEPLDAEDPLAFATDPVASPSEAFAVAAGEAQSAPALVEPELRAEVATPPAAAAALKPAPALPPAPASLSAILASPVEVELRWQAAAGGGAVAGYEVLRGEQVITSTRQTVARIPAPPAARRTCLAVRAVDAAGARSAPSEAACVTVPDVTPPSAPWQLEARARADGVDLRWSPASDDVGVAAYEVVRDGTVIAKVSTNSARETGLRPGHPYCYSVRAIDAAGNASPPAGPSCAEAPDVTPPSSPGRPFARARSDTVIGMHWGKATDDVGVARYDVLRDGKVVASVSGVEAELHDLAPAVKYCHVVRACDGAGNCSPPSEAACAITPDLTPPRAVAHVSAEVVSDRRIDVRWTPTTDDVGVVRYEVHDGDRVLVAGQSLASLADAWLSPGTRHCYVVVARDAAGNESAASPQACATTPDLTPPTAPPEVVAAGQSGSQIMVSWRPATDDVGVAGYEALRDGAVVATVRRREVSIAQLSPETEYCVAIRAFDAAGHRSPTSAPACAKTTPASTPGAPWNVRAQTTKKQELLLSWEPSTAPGVVYAVYWDGRRGEKRVATTPAPSFKVFGAAAKERHCYRVVAIDEAEHESPRSFPFCGAIAGAGTQVADDADVGDAVVGAGSGGAP